MTGGKPVVAEGYITTAEAVELTGYHIEHVRQLVRRGDIEAVKIAGRTWLVNHQSLLDYQANVKMGRPRKAGR